MSKLSHQALFVFKIFVSGLLFWLIINNIDLEDTLNILLQLDYEVVILCLAVLSIQYIINTFRWQNILKRLYKKLGFLRIFNILLIGAFFNQSLPSTIGGDAIRIWKIRQLGHPLGVATMSVVLDRVTALLTLMLIITISLPYLFRILDHPVFSVLLSVTPIVGIICLLLLLYVDRLPRIFLLWIPTRFILRLIRDSHKIFLASHHTLKIILLATMTHLLSGVVVYLLALGLEINVGIIHCLLLTPLVILISTLPISLAGWGLREGVMVIVFSYIGVTSNEALAISILFGLAILLTGIPGGILWILDRKKTKLSGENAIIT